MQWKLMRAVEDFDDSLTKEQLTLLCTYGHRIWSSSAYCLASR